MNIDNLSSQWKRSPRRWGHPLQSLCSYFAMFPPQIPHVFIQWLTEPGDVVYDPFSGRGTAPLEACRMGRLGMGSDANPLAYTLTAAKVDPPTEQQAQLRISELRNAYPGKIAYDVPSEIHMLYSPHVLGQLAWLRDNLDLERRDDRFVMALLLGVMHANYTPGHPARGLSISMPNTFSMSPGYVRRYIEKNGLKPPEVDVFELLTRKLGRMHLPGAGATRGRAWQQDAREPAPTALAEQPAKLVFTSPPYLNVIKYGKYNWVRLWMLKEEPKKVDAKLVATGSLSRYLRFIKEVLNALTPAVRNDGYVCLMIGDVFDRNSRRTINLAQCIWEETAEPLGWRLRGIVSDQLPIQNKVSRIWMHRRGKATKTDRILILARMSRRSAELPVLNPICWTEATTWL